MNRTFNVKSFCLGGLAAFSAVMLSGFTTNQNGSVTEPEATAALAGKQCSQAEEDKNRDIVAAIKPMSAYFHSIIADDYIQHGPEYAVFAEINKVSNKDAVKMIEENKLGRTGSRFGPRLPGQPDDDFSYKIVADCDIVIAVSKHWHPFPNDKTRFYPAYYFNMWRLENGKLAEHWDPDDLSSPVPDFLTTPLHELNLSTETGNKEKS